ncbi:MAG: N-formylglutamate deformylase [Boseongicola sp.]|nr:MAG: N-formylglutamate deformylase [Boseongicola sp.]
MTPVEVQRGDGPIVLGMPHTGTYVPDEIFKSLNANGRRLADTDWHIDRLYDGLLPGATTVRATFHRYVIDANRDPNGASLYPGQNTTTLVPLTDFDGVKIWSKQPDDAEVKSRLSNYHQAYHNALNSEIQRAAGRHGIAILYDCHSIRSEIPFLFDGTLPDFNVGTDGTTTCAPELETHVVESLTMATSYTSTLNGRFKGGWTTRHYGHPAKNIHAIQMELSQSTYLATEAAPWEFDPVKAQSLRPIFQLVLQQLADLASKLGILK